MQTWEANVRRVVPYTPGEQPDCQDMIKLNTNENPYPPAPQKAIETKTGTKAETVSCRGIDHSSACCYRRDDTVPAAAVRDTYY